MTDPKRILDTSDELPEIRRLLRAARRDAPPSGLKAAAWSALASKVILTGTASASAATASAAAASATAASLSPGTGAAVAGTLGKTALMATALKWAAVGVGLGSAVLLTRGALSISPATPLPVAAPSSAPPVLHAPHGASRPPSGPSPAPQETASSPLPAVAAPQQVPEAELPPNSAYSSRSTTVRDVRAEQTRAEALRVAEVRSAVRRGDSAWALSELAALDREMPRGLLRQEREAFRIDALLATGRTSEARTRAQSFRRRYPESPYASRWSSLGNPEE